MATQFTEQIPVPLVDPVVSAINQLFDRLIFSLQQRRIHLLTALRDRREEMRASQVAGQQMEEELVASQRLLEVQMKHNLLHSVQEKILGELENKRTELRANVPIPQELKFIYHTKELEEQIDHL